MNASRILFVTAYMPSPPRYGGQRRLEGLIRGLSRRHAVSVVSHVDPREDVSCSLRATETYCEAVVAVPNAFYGASPRRKRLQQTRSLLSTRSYESFVYDSDPLRLALEKLVTDNYYDVVSFEVAQMVTNQLMSAWPDGRRPAFIFDAHNIEYDLLRRTAASTRGLDRRIYAELDWRKLRSEERAAWQLVDGCTVTSSRDEGLIRRDAPTVRTSVVPNAVDVDFFRPCLVGGPVDPQTVLFFGAISYHPNTDGLLFFIREILPLLKARYPAIKLRIVGPSVPPEIRAHEGDGIEVTGVVDDIRPYLAGATVIIAPLRVGGGTRFKILEAMAMQKPVVSTAVGAEGIGARDGTEILIGDRPEDFARQVGRLLEDEGLRRRMGAAARAVIEDRYSWNASVAHAEEFYDELVDRRAAAVGV
jgi:glycosyltransferase involved in cell wall biosynthesis